MVCLKAFRGVLYNNAKFPDFSAVITPPYDVISKEEQQAYLNLNSYNSIRLILPPKDNYESANQYFRNWLAGNILIKDQKPGIYILLQEYQYRDIVYQRCGFIALAKVEDLDSGVIFPHEKTFSGPKADRLKLLQTTRANFDQVFVIYDDQNREVDSILAKIAARPPLVSYTSADNILHQLWKMEAANDIKELTDLMKNEKAVIADGHHRYSTARNFDPQGFTPLYFANMHNPGLIVLPLHRVVKGVAEKILTNLMKRLGLFFTLKKMNRAADLLKEMAAHQTRHAFGLFKDQEYYLLILKDKSGLDKYLQDEFTRGLDVAIFQALLLEQVLEITPESVSYTSFEDRAVKMVQEKKCQLAFFLNATPVEEVLRVATHGHFMPQKSTYFYPKLPSGLVMRDMLE